jgi:hypothetical protein
MSPILFPRKGSRGGGGRGGGGGGDGERKYGLIPLWITIGIIGGAILIGIAICLYYKIRSVRDKKQRRAADVERYARANPAISTRGVTTTQQQQQQQLQVPVTTNERRSADVTEARGEVMTEISLTDPPRVQ